MEILNRIQAIVTRHTKSGFHGNEYHVDNELKKIEEDLVPYKLESEHKQTSDRKIRTLKYRNKSTVHLVPYKNMTMLMIESIVEQVQSMLNTFPSKTGILTTMSAINIIEERPNLGYNTMSLNLGACVQLF